ncbi:hypothetical protein PENSPDRAFT_694866 [Peniophora sp. CONT]|nr:hypothetical protein PENSPDRAFT_694866 [Peniophora sp. CONT]
MQAAASTAVPIAGASNDDDQTTIATAGSPTQRFHTIYADDGELLGQMSEPRSVERTGQQWIRVRRSRITDLHTHIRRLMRALETAEMERDALRDDVELLEDERDGLRDECIMFRDERDSANQQRDELETAHGNLLNDIDDLETRVTEVNVSIDESIQCNICNEHPRDPHSLRECGHTFCFNCLMTWHANAYASAQRNQRTRVPPAVPPIHPAQVDRLHLPRETVRAIFDEQNRLVHRRPNFTCPYCRTLVSQAPVPNYSVANLVQRVAEEAAQEGEQMRPDAMTMMRTFFLDAYRSH